MLIFSLYNIKTPTQTFVDELDPTDLSLFIEQSQGRNQTLAIDEARSCKGILEHTLQKILKSRSSETLSETFFMTYFNLVQLGATGDYFLNKTYFVFNLG